MKTGGGSLAYDKGESKVPLCCDLGRVDAVELRPLVVGREEEKDDELRVAPG